MTRCFPAVIATDLHRFAQMKTDYELLVDNFATTRARCESFFAASVLFVGYVALCESLDKQHLCSSV
jgi:hypothetical protein